MNQGQKALIRYTWRQLAAQDNSVVCARFFDRLFYIAPEVRALFLSGASEQAKKLMALLQYMVRNLDQPEEVRITLAALAARHVGSSIKPYQYAIVGNALLWTLEQSLVDYWSEEAEDAWASYYTLLTKPTAINVFQAEAA